ncbi:MAG: rubrerythrin family protein [Oscillospiraceae bacterium]|nr:rubrerythrin family protein [Oscillospiraceae bacterium]
MDFNSSQTRINLMRAFAGESQARNRYTFAAETLKQQGWYFLYNIFTLTANQEKAHAKIFYDHLKNLNGSPVEIPQAAYPVDNYDNAEQLLRAAQHNEYGESDDVYPEFARIAREEGFPEVAFSFEKIALIEKEHGERFSCLAELMEKSKMFSGEKDTEWFCLNCGHIHKGPAVPEHCPVCSSDRGYFVPFKYYKLIAEKYGLPVME